MIKQFSLQALEKAINQALSLDEQIAEKTQALHGKVIEIIVMPLAVNFFLTFDQSGLKLLANYSDVPDTIIESSPLGLIRLSLLPASRARSLFNDNIKLSGNTEVGMQVKQLFDDLDIDWEGHLAHFTGDIIAHQVGSFVKQGFAFHQRLTQSMRTNLTEYVQEEVRLFPSGEEAHDFFNDVDIVVHAVERLSAKMQLLMADYEIN